MADRKRYYVQEGGLGDFVVKDHEAKDPVCSCDHLWQANMVADSLNRTTIETRV